MKKLERWTDLKLMDLLKDLPQGKQILKSVSYFNNLYVQLQSDKLFNGSNVMDIWMFVNCGFKILKL